ncbi:hypothetical protein PGTUg99_023243 [Puccinia graminis f. sp. tritici]|uniref:Uncharacterized protein n=1 Tax=Puccinia graminis f. sp. tritici TaxID=56615 RepID=A0A5B0S6U0_PUCGR|nr:hypothetical protein PGTUg99_023243 [Puccinia graminis f. sp. tritici]
MPSSSRSKKKDGLEDARELDVNEMMDEEVQAIEREPQRVTPRKYFVTGSYNHIDHLMLRQTGKYHGIPAASCPRRSAKIVDEDVTLG